MSPRPSQFDAADHKLSTLDKTAIYSATDVKGRITEVNDRFCELSGYAREELIGQTHRIVNSGLHDRRLFRGMYRTIGRGQPWRGELRNKAKDGSFYWVDCTIVPIVGPAGKVTDYSSIRVDITARKQAEEALRASETMLRSTLLALSEGVVVQDAGGRIVSCNPAAQAILQLSESQLTGVTSFDPRWKAIREDGSDFPGTEHPAMVALRTGVAQHQVMMGLSKDDGSVTWISINSKPIFEAEAAAPTSVVSSFSDVTARRLAQEMLSEAVGAISDGFVIYDNNDRLTICNDAYKEIYAKTAPVIRPGVSFSDVVRFGVANGQYPEAGITSGQREAWIAERIERHRNPPPDIVQQLDDGRWLQVRERKTASGYIVGVRTDVTRLKAETAKLRAVIDNFPGGIAVLDGAGRLAAYNEGFRTLLDLPAEFLAERTPTMEEIVRFNAARGEYGADAETTVATYLGHIGAGQPYAFERVRSDGVVIAVRGAPIAGGGSIATFVDITEKYEAMRLLRISEERATAQSGLLQNTLAHMRQGLTMFDAAGRLLVWNDRYRTLYGLPAQVIYPGAYIRDLLVARQQAGAFDFDIDEFLRDLAASLKRDGSRTLLIATRDGRTIEVVFKALEGGGWVATHDDVTERKHSEEVIRARADELARLNMQLDIALGSMSQGLCLFTPDKKLALSNRRFRELYGLSAEQVRPGVDLRSILEAHIENGQTADMSVDEFVTSMPLTANQTLQLIDGRTIAIQRSPTPDGGWVAVHDDVTEREEASRQISHLAYHDVLTGLANRAEFKIKGEMELVKAASQDAAIAVMLIDLDRFKAVNDSFGHAAGDILLKVVAERMSEHVRAGDIVARLGGDEFAIIQGPVDNQIEAAKSLAARLVDVLSRPYDIEGHQANIGASIGISVSCGKQTIEQLMHQADLALYKVKAAGRNGFRVYEDDIGTQEDQRVRLGEELRDALARDELMLHYQPIVSIADGTILGMEALLRWHHPVHGEMTPDRLIPIAEESGLIVALGEFVIGRACADALGWPDHVKVAINISPSHIKKRVLFDAVTSTLLKTRLPPERLELEVTETVLLQRDDEILAELTRLQGIGISIALDDFGIGYSSLSQLRMFPFDKLKIDRLFVAEMTERSDSAAIVCSIVGLARALGIAVVAEGIETELQRKVLLAAGCPQGQGYLFGKPEPFAVTCALLGAGRKAIAV